MMMLGECSACGYACVGPCSNPGCYENPNVPETTKELWRLRDEKLKREEAERAAIRRVRIERLRKDYHA